MTHVIAVNKNGYRPQGNMCEAWRDKSPEMIISGPAETGKSYGALHKLNALCCIYPNSQAAIIRKVQSSMYGTVLTSFQKKVLARPDSVQVVGKLHPERFIYPNGSEIWVAGIDNPSKALSSERDFIYVNQAEELTIADWEYLITRTTGRAGNAPFSLLFGDCNPDAPTHWIKTRSKKGGTLRRIDTVHKDNPVLYDVNGKVTEQGKKTIKILQSLTGARRQRLYLGMWVSPEGAIYDALEERHTTESFEIPTSWPRFVGVDPFGAFISAVWLAWEEENKKLHVYREYYEPFGVSTPTHVSNIIRRTGSETVFAWAGGGPSERQARADFKASGIPLQAPPIAEVWAGIDRVNQLILDDAIIIHDNCPGLLSEFGAYKRKVVNGQPTEQIQDKDTFHLLDALRYIVSYLTDGEMSRVVYDPVEIGRDW